MLASCDICRNTQFGVSSRHEEAVRARRVGDARLGERAEGTRRPVAFPATAPRGDASSSRATGWRTANSTLSRRSIVRTGASRMARTDSLGRATIRIRVPGCFVPPRLWLPSHERRLDDCSQGVGFRDAPRVRADADLRCLGASSTTGLTWPCRDRRTRVFPVRAVARTSTSVTALCWSCSIRTSKHAPRQRRPRARSLALAAVEEGANGDEARHVVLCSAVASSSSRRHRHARCWSAISGSRTDAYPRACSYHASSRSPMTIAGSTFGSRE